MDSKQQTLRLTGLPLATQIDDVKQFFGDRIKPMGRQHVESVGPFSQAAISPHKQTTVSFSSHDAATQALGLDYASRRFMARSGGVEHISLDDTFEDITTLHSCANPETGRPDIDIVALHGLNGHAWNTFTTSEIVDKTAHNIREFNWLRDRLPMLLEHQRIYPRVMSFGYNADVWMTKSVADISVPVENMLQHLDIERQQDPQRPLFFIGHSLGGIVVKEAIVALADAAITQTINPDSPTQGRYVFPVKGCMFFGVPHKGANIADKALRFLNVLSLVFNVNKNNIQDLKSKSQRFANISSNFRAIQTEHDFPVISFFETVKYKHHGLIVEQESATYDYPGCPKPFGVNRNHTDIAKYSTGDDHALKPAVNFLARIASDAIALRNVSSHPTIAPPPRPALVDDEGRPVEDKLSILADYDTVFLVDDSPSMQGQKWELVHKILDYSIVIATWYDTDGIDIHFMNNPNANQDDVKDPQVAAKTHRDIELKGNTPLRDRLSRHLREYLRKFMGHETNKSYNLIVLTDGEPNPEYEDPADISDIEDAKKYKAAFRLIRKRIVTIAKKLDDIDAEPGQIGIQFCQVGNDRDATAFFEFVDDQLKGKHRLGRDMVDFIKCQSERDLTEAFFEKLLLGAIDKRLDHEEMETQHPVKDSPNKTLTLPHRPQTASKGKERQWSEDETIVQSPTSALEERPSSMIASGQTSARFRPASRHPTEPILESEEPGLQTLPRSSTIGSFWWKRRS